MSGLAAVGTTEAAPGFVGLDRGASPQPRSGGGLRTLRRVGADKRALATAIATHSARLAPGAWVLSQIGSAHHLRSKQSGASQRWMAGIKGSVLKRQLIKTSIAAVPPAMVWVKRGRKQAPKRGGATELLMTKAGGLLLFDTAANQVTHIRREPFPADYQQRREALARQLPSPAWQLSEDRETLTETLFEGDFLADCAPAAKEKVAREFFERARDLARAARRGESTAVVRDALAVFDSIPDLSPDIIDVVEASRDRLIAAASGWPLVPAHGDLSTGQNVIVGRTGDWTLIDFEDADDLPYFFDPLSLLVGDADLVQVLAGGQFDQALLSVNEAAGLPSSAVDVPLWSAAVALIAAARHASRHGGEFGRSWRRIRTPK